MVLSRGKSQGRDADVQAGVARGRGTCGPSKREMRRAWLRRDPAYDGVFCFGVRTTGVFCRPSCRARRPRPANVVYFGEPREALAAGYRPCRRCCPLAANGQAPEWVTRLLRALEDGAGSHVRDDDLAALGVHPARARRYFKEHFGMTFQAYQRKQRLGRALGQLQRGDDALGVGFEHGFESVSGFRDAFGRVFGATPGRARDTECITVEVVPSPVGPLLLGATRAALCVLEFLAGDSMQRQLELLRKRFGPAIVPGGNAVLARARRELEEYFAGTRRTFDVPLHSPGTAFEQRVWGELLRIPYGQTRSYQDIARALGQPTAQRAVGLANGRNRIAILIPCHRVVNKGGGLGGYGGGLWRKQHLLNLERGERDLLNK